MMKKTKMKRVPKLRFPEFTDDWEQRKLSDMVDVLDGDRGKNYPTSDDFDISGHTLFLNASNVTNDGFLFQDNQFITEVKSNSMGNGKLEEDDIVVTSRGSLGHIGWYNADVSSFIPYARINSGMLILRNKKEVETEYLYHFMKSDKGQSQISFMSFGSAQPQLTKKGVEDLDVVLPIRRDEQSKLGYYFSYLDHLITLHQRKLKNLNVLKKCVMQKLFSQKVRFKADDGSEFPKWKEKRLGDVFTERTERSKGGETLLSVTIAQGIVRQSETDKRNTASENKSNYKIVKRNDLAYNTMRMWQGAEGVSEYDGIVSPAYTVITALDGNNSYFFEILFKQTFMLQIFQRYSQGLTSDTWNLKFPAFSEIKCLVPCEDEQNKIVECVKVLDSVIEKQKATLAAWEELKKGLLQQMFV